MIDKAFYDQLKHYVCQRDMVVWQRCIECIAGVSFIAEGMIVLVHNKWCSAIHKSDELKALNFQD